MPRTLHLYMDESNRNLSRAGVPPISVLLVGGLLLPAPLVYCSARWYQDLLRHPHASDRPKPRATKNGQRKPLGQPVWTALAAGKMADGSLTVLATADTDPKGGVIAQHYEAAYLGLILEIVARERLTDRDTVHLYPERFGPGGAAAIEGRFQGLVGALRWLWPADVPMPRFEFTGFPKDPNILVGHAAVDLILYNLGRAMLEPANVDWSRALIDGAREMGLESSRFAHISAIPPLADGAALRTWADQHAGRLATLDWAQLAADLDATSRRRIQLAWRRPGLRTRTVVRAVEALGKLNTDQSSPLASDVPPRRVRDLLIDMTPAIEEADDRRATRRWSFALAQAHTRCGQLEEALAAWEMWRTLGPGSPDSPNSLADYIRGVTAQLEMLIDLEAWDRVEELAIPAIRLMDENYSSFPRSPARARLLAAVARTKVLSGRLDSPADFDAIHRSASELSATRDRDQAWAWSLVALGRGEAEDTTQRMQALIQQIHEHHGTSLRELVESGHPFLRWGLAEAAAQPRVAKNLTKAMLSTIDDAMDSAAASGLPLPHPTPLALRANGIRRRNPELLAMSAAHTPCSAGPLRRGDLQPRMALRTAAARALFTPRAPGVQDSFLKIRDTALEAVEAMPHAPVLSGLRRRLRSFTTLSWGDDDALAAFMEMGGY